MPNSYFEQMIVELKTIKAILIAYANTTMNESQLIKFIDVLNEQLKKDGLSNQQL